MINVNANVTQSNTTTADNLLALFQEIITHNNFNSLSEIFEYSFNSEMEHISKLSEVYYLRTLLLINFLEGSLIIDDNLKKEKVSSFKGGLTVLNEKLKNKVINGITELTLDNFYPSLILGKNQELSNLRGHRKALEESFLFYTQSNLDPDSEVVQAAKQYLNFTFGMLGSNKNFITPRINPKTIANKGRMVMRQLTNEFEGHAIYTDTDSIYFCRYSEIQDRLDDYLKKLHQKNPYYQFTFNSHQSGIFLGKKKFLLMKGEYNSKGLRIVT